MTSIGGYAFYGCNGFTSIAIPSSVINIGVGIFNGCKNLESISVENGNTVYDSRERCNAIIKTATNTLIAGGKSSTIPNSVTCIGESAFAGRTSMTSLTIPSSVTSIGRSAFFGCTGLVSVTSFIEKPFDIDDDIFVYWNAEKNDFELIDVTLYVPQGTKILYEKTSGWNVFGNIVEMTEEETNVKDVYATKQSTIPVTYYNLDGQKFATPQKGINIVKYSNGIMKKVLVK